MEARNAELRVDARRNRERLIAAGRELFRDSADVPMYEVARYAEVGQATLYRHFPDRFALAEAISKVEFADVLELGRTRGDDSETLYLMLREMAGRVAGLRGLIEVLRRDAPVEAHERRREETASLFAGPLAAAHRDGTVRPDFNADDILRILMMIQGAIGDETDQEARHGAAMRALDLLVDGMRPSLSPGSEIAPRPRPSRPPG